MSERLDPELERIARMLREAGPLPDAPPGMRERALAIPDDPDVGEHRAHLLPRAEPAPAPHVEPEPAPRPRARRRRSLWRPVPLAGLAAVVLALVVPAIAIVRGDGDQRVAMAARSFAPKGGGVAFVSRTSGSATIELRVWKMPRPGAGKTYEAWLGRRGERRALGTFGIDDAGRATVSFEVPRGELEDYRWLWVTSEPAGGSPAPSEDTALWGRLT